MPPLSNVARAVSAAALAALSMAKLRRFKRKHFLRLVNLGVLQLFEARDFIQRQIGKQPHKAPHVGILRVSPDCQ